MDSNQQGFTVNACLIWRVSTPEWRTNRELAILAQIGPQQAKTAIWSLLTRGMLDQNTGVDPYRYRVSDRAKPDLIAKIERASHVWCNSPVADRRPEVLAVLGDENV